MPEFQITQAGLKFIQTLPEKGPAGTSFEIRAEGLPPGSTGEFVWVTVNGAYELQPEGRVEYHRRSFTPLLVSLGRVTTGSDGKVSGRFTAPEDYGEVHDTYLVVDGGAVAKGGFRLLRSFSMTPEEGPVGTLITLTVTGLGWKPFESTAALRYDNHYTGFISATTTRGTAVVQFRAAGPVGPHYISVDAASHTQPFLNITTGAASTRHLLPFDATFNVTRDSGAPKTVVQWAAEERLATVQSLGQVPSIGQMNSAPGVTIELSPGHSPILAHPRLRVSGLTPGDADLVWTTGTGTRSDPINQRSDYTLDQRLLDRTAVGADGAIDVALTVPEGLGGWHSVRVIQSGKLMGEAPIFVDSSLVGLTKARLTSGEKFTVRFQAGGWTELDNGVAVTYDNSYIGYVCGYANNGDTLIELTATGGRGTHLIDIYPYIYDGGHGDWPWQLNMPQLTALRDHPGLALGYRLPIMRLAIEIVD